MDLTNVMKEMKPEYNCNMEDIKTTSKVSLLKRKSKLTRKRPASIFDIDLDQTFLSPPKLKMLKPTDHVEELSFGSDANAKDNNRNHVFRLKECRVDLEKLDRSLVARLLNKSKSRRSSTSTKSGKITKSKQYPKTSKIAFDKSSSPATKSKSIVTAPIPTARRSSTEGEVSKPRFGRLINETLTSSSSDSSNDDNDEDSKVSRSIKDDGRSRTKYISIFDPIHLESSSTNNEQRTSSSEGVSRSSLVPSSSPSSSSSSSSLVASSDHSSIVQTLNRRKSSLTSQEPRRSSLKIVSGTLQKKQMMNEAKEKERIEKEKQKETETEKEAKEGEKLKKERLKKLEKEKADAEKMKVKQEKEEEKQIKKAEKEAEAKEEVAGNIKPQQTSFKIPKHVGRSKEELRAGRFMPTSVREAHQERLKELLRRIDAINEEEVINTEKIEKHRNKPRRVLNQEEDEEDVKDLNDEGWQELKCLESENDRLKYFQKRYSNIVPSDPGVNLSYHGFKRRNQGKIEKPSQGSKKYLFEGCLLDKSRKGDVDEEKAQRTRVPVDQVNEKLKQLALKKFGEHFQSSDPTSVDLSNVKCYLRHHNLASKETTEFINFYAQVILEPVLNI